MTLNVAQNGWCPESEAMVRRLWGTLSTRKIGALLGCTHNAVIGKAHRLGLQATTSPIKRGVQPKQPQRPRDFALPPLPTAVVVPFPERRIAPPPPPRPSPPRIGPASGCQWTSSNGRPWVFCDAAATDGSWCDEHFRRVFIPRRDVADAAD